MRIAANIGARHGPAAGRTVGGVAFVAEAGEDRLLADWFGDHVGVYVEVGASDGVTISTTWHFEQAGWSGVLIEADPTSAAKCRTARPGSVVVEAAAVGPDDPAVVPFHVVDDLPQLSSRSFRHGAEWIGMHEDRVLGRTATITEVEVRAATLDELIEEAGVEHVDFVTIDVEGHERDVVAGFTPERWQPEFVILERVGWPDRFVQRRMRAAGYLLCRRTGMNDWYGRAARSGLVVAAWRFVKVAVAPVVADAVAHPRRTLRLRTRLRRLMRRSS